MQNVPQWSVCRASMRLAGVVAADSSYNGQGSCGDGGGNGEYVKTLTLSCFMLRFMLNNLIL